MSLEYVNEKIKGIEDVCVETNDCIAKIVKSVGAQPSWPVFLFENKDDTFYSSFFSHEVKKQHSSVRCKNKEGVLKTFKEVQANKGVKDNVYAFVDQDFDGIPAKKNDRLFYTSGYAIENYYCSEDTFELFLRNELNVQKIFDEDKYNYLKKLYYDKFVNDLALIKDLNSWAFFQRKNGYGCKEVRFNDINKQVLKKIINEKDVFSFLEKNFPDAKKIPDSEKNNLERNRIHSNPVEFYRGKWVFILFEVVVKQLIEDSGDLYKQKKINAKPELHEVNMSSFISYIPLPPSLGAFIKKNKL